ncbi:MAG: hypothetical protein ACPGVB_10280 [Chitinophagales bacterium]
MKGLKIGLNVVLLLIVAFLTFTLVNTVKEPIDFENEKTRRNDALVSKLEKIRQSQTAYKNLYKEYASKWDTLVTVVKNDSFEVSKVIGNPDDSTVVTKVEIIKISILDSLFAGKTSAADSLPFVPNTAGTTFDLQADTIVRNGVTIPAFEASVPYTDAYTGLKKKYYAQKIGDAFKVGSIKEGHTNISY